MSSDELTDDIPAVTSRDAVDHLVAQSKRVEGIPLRRAFTQREIDDEKKPGPLAALVAASDRRALLLYLLLMTKASAEPWDAALPAAAWARVLNLPLPESKSSRTVISKAWNRLEDHNLVTRTRWKRWAHLHLLREDGSGEEYTNPFDDNDLYFRVPLALWTDDDPESGKRWYEVLTVPELALLIIGRSFGDGFPLPREKAPEWYGISADTVSRGVDGLESRGLLKIEKKYRKAPLSPTGFTAENRYTLEPPFGPVGFASGSATARKALKSPKTAGKSSTSAKSAKSSKATKPKKATRQRAAKRRN